MQTVNLTIDSYSTDLVPKHHLLQYLGHWLRFVDDKDIPDCWYIFGDNGQGIKMSYHAVCNVKADICNEQKLQ